MEDKQTVEEAIKEMFSFPKIEDPNINESVRAVSSMLYICAMAVIRSKSRKREGWRSIELMQEAFLYFLASQSGPRPEEKNPEQPELIAVP